jgi:enoyl-CoA hydratase/carnithine racemase
MAGSVKVEQEAGVVRLSLCHPQRFNAMSLGMWRELRQAFERIHTDKNLRCVLVRGEGEHFCAGGDISEYAGFRFEESSLRDFHEVEVWGALSAMLACELPLVAQIEGHCMGAGIEIASCCDIRLSSESARFGAPIARLGFPMAPREAALVARELGLSVTRQMLLEAAVFGASQLHACGFLSRVLAQIDLATEVQTSLARISELSPQAARLNKRTLRALQGGYSGQPDSSWQVDSSDSVNSLAYSYADSPEHREGIAAFLEKRKPMF